MMEEQNSRINQPLSVISGTECLRHVIAEQSRIANAFEYADQVLEHWYPIIEEGNNKGIGVPVTSQKEGAVTDGTAFIRPVGKNIPDASISDNLPGMYALQQFFMFNLSDKELPK
ncbi:hypothetical protein SLA2020_504890 [Shorea laevis]